MATVLVELKDALKESYIRPKALEEFLRTRLEKRFDDFTSRNESLSINIDDIVTHAHDEWWLPELILKAAEHRPQNATLQKLKALLPELKPPPVAAGSRIDRPSLVCGRGTQWQKVSQCAPTHLHQTLLVPGGLGQEPLHFRERVQVSLTPNPLRDITVTWRTLPASLNEMIEALAIALGSTIDGAAGALRDRLARQNVILLHPCIDGDFDKPHFIDYYTRWLPDALEPKTGGVVKCIQPLEWAVREPGGVLRRLFSGNRTREREQAFDLIRELKSRHREHMPILNVNELLNLEEWEIDEFLEGSVFKPVHQKILRKDLIEGPELPLYIFKRIDEYWERLGGTHERT